MPSIICGSADTGGSLALLPLQAQATFRSMTVVINGRVVKFFHQLVGQDLAKARDAAGQTVDYLRGELGEDAWNEGMHPEIPDPKVRENPYTYTYTDDDAPAG